MAEENLIETKNYRIVRKSLQGEERIFLKGDSISSLLIEGEYVSPIGYAIAYIAYFADDKENKKTGSPSEIKNWSGVQVTQCRSSLYYLKKKGLLDFQGNPTDELLKLGERILPLVEHYRPELFGLLEKVDPA